MNRYLLFKGGNYYPSGGWEDYVNDFKYKNEAIGFCKVICEDDPLAWAHVVDMEVDDMTESMIIWSEGEENMERVE